MSGDLGPRVAIEAVQKFTSKFEDVDILLVGNEQCILEIRSAQNLLSQHISVLNATDVVAMDEDPLKALRYKKNSSMWLAIESLKNLRVDACVSAGNTGALLAMGKHLLKMFPGIERPAICKSIPVEKGFTYLLDLGANTDCTAEQLYQFALMGYVLASAVEALPRIGLLNNGTELTKGTETIKAAQLLLQNDKRLNYCGYVEASDIFSGEKNVIVCDGFHGNIALKASEGTARFIAKKIKEVANKSFLNKTIASIVAPLFRKLSQELDPAMYNGAIFLGLQKVLVKSHGDADVTAFMHALVVARDQVIQGIPARIQHQLSTYSFSSPRQ